MQRVVLDTDVASLSIKQQLPPTLLRELVGAQVGVTFITLGELARWATMRQWGMTRRAELDTWIAACCLVYNLPLATLNTKDFKDFAEHEGLVLFGARR